MKKEEIQKWIRKNEEAIKQNTFLIERCREEIEFGKKIIEEIKNIKTDEERDNTRRIIKL